MTRTRIATAAVVGVTLLGGGLWMYRRAEASEAPSDRYALVFQQALMSYYTGEMEPESVTL